MQIDLTGKNVLVTAGASGIGNRIIRGFISSGANVYSCDVDESAVMAFREDSPDVGMAICDVADDTAVGRLFDEIGEKLGDLDILVNNAGIGGPTASLVDIEPEDWRRTIDVDLNSMFYTCRRAIPMMKKRGGGLIVNMSSAAGRLGMPLRTPYSSAKFGVIGLTKALAIELGEDAIRVNAILPGNVESPRTKRIIKNTAATLGINIEKMTKRFLARSVLQQYVAPSEIADMILYLSSPSARNITGQAINIDGDDQTMMFGMREFPE